MNPTVREPKSSERAWSLLHRFAEEHDRRGELAEALGFRLGGGKGKILFQLRDGPMTLRELAATNRIDAPYVTLIVDQLEAHDLVERRPHPEDKRRKLVALTASGHDAITVADEILSRPPLVLQSLTRDELDQLIHLLGRLVEDEGSNA